MTERNGPISRIPLPNQGIDRVVVPPDPSRGERPLSGVLMGIWRGRWIVIACVAISLIVGYIRVALAVPVYNASSTIAVQSNSPIIPDILASQTQSGGYIYTQIQTIHSTKLLENALKNPDVANAECLRGFDNPVVYLKNAVIVTPDKQGGDLINVEMVSTNPRDAAAIVNGVVKAYIDFQSDQHSATAVELMQILQKAIASQGDELKAEQQALTDFKKKNPALVRQIEEGNQVNSPLENELSVAKQKTLDLKIAKQEGESYPNDPEILKQIADNVAAQAQLPLANSPVVDPVVDSEYHRACSELLVAGGIKNSPQYAQLQSRQLQLEAEVRRERDAAVKRYTMFLDHQATAAQQRQDQLQAKVDEDRNRRDEVFAKAADYKQLVQQTDNTQRALDTLYNQYKTVNVTHSSGTLTATVLEPAKASSMPVGLGRSQKMLMALVVGLMIGLGASLLRELLEQRLRSVDEVSRLLTPTVLGSVPHIISRPVRLLSGAGRAPGAPLPRYLRAVGSRNSREWSTAQSLMQRGQAMHLQSRSDIAEAYRAIRTAIYYGLRGHPAKTILITSPSSGDGKTTLASNLAIAMAQAGRRVLLIDADCWHPTMHSIFALGDGLGLTSILRKKTTLADVVRKTDVENLEILPCGEVPNNPAELLDSQAMIDLLAEVSGKYDQVLIDSPPVVPITDARILAASSGATILVLRAGKSTRRLADAAFAALSAVGAPILGVVVNDVARQSQGRGFQYHRYMATEPTERPNWDQYEPAPNTNGHTSAEAKNGNGQIVHLPVEIIEPGSNGSAGDRPRE